MPAPTFFVASATHVSADSNSGGTNTSPPPLSSSAPEGIVPDKKFLTEPMLGMFNHLAAKHNYHPQDTASPGNTIAMIDLLQDLSSPLTYPIKEHHGFLSHIWNKLAHPSGKTNPFGKVTGGQGTYRIMERNWQQVLWDVAQIICNSIYDSSARELLYKELQNLVATASTYQTGPGSDATQIVKHVLSTEGETPTLAMYWINVELGNILYNNPFPSMMFSYSYTVFGFDKRKLERIDPQIIPPKSSIEQWVEKLTSPKGPYPERVCW